jgi:hypothetical protein
LATCFCFWPSSRTSEGVSVSFPSPDDRVSLPWSQLSMPNARRFLGREQTG